MTEYDGPWKEVLDAFLKDFLELCLPNIHEGIDWDNPIENQEQELPKLFPNSLSVGRLADRLFRAKFRGSNLQGWFLLHTEVQVTRRAEFARRMHACFYRILDRFEEPVVCIGILGDDSKSWRPDHWEIDTFGCQLRFVYPVVKLQDFANRIEALQTSTNPFATVIAAHLRAQGSQGNPHSRYGFKLELVRSLYAKQWDADQIRQLFRFIDWVMDLPKSFEIQFRDTLIAFETEKNMPYVTSIERLGEARGEANGEAKGEIRGKIKLLQELLGLPVMADLEFANMTPQQLEELFSELRQRFDAR